jgi:hypothetical protein
MEKGNSLETLLQLKNNQIKILEEIIDNREEMITILKDSLQSYAKHIEDLISIIDNLKMLVSSHYECLEVKK